MRKWAMLLLVAKFACMAAGERPAVTQRVTVERLEQALATAHSRKDRRLARQISGMKLTERLSSAGLMRLEQGLPGPQSAEALIAIADESAFLDLPPAEIPSRPAPTPAEQTAMLSLAVEYVTTMIAQWPNFTATRQTTRFEGTATVIPGELQDMFFSLDSGRAPSAANWECPGQPKIGHERLSVIDRSNVTVVNRDGHELHALGERGGEFECPENAVSTTEEFGKVLAWVPKIVAHGNLTWSHWEADPGGLLAVFRYATIVSHRSMPVEIHGEIAINPANGSILRLAETRHWTKREPASEAGAAYDAVVEYGSAVDYGPVNLGGTVYLCPVKRVAVYHTPILRPLGSNAHDDQLYRKFGLSESPLQEYLNDVSFTQYRLYGSS